MSFDPWTLVEKRVRLTRTRTSGLSGQTETKTAEGILDRVSRPLGTTYGLWIDGEIYAADFQRLGYWDSCYRDSCTLTEIPEVEQ